MTDTIVKKADDVKLIVFACEAGMGSSAMGAKQLMKMCKKAKLDVQVIHSAVGQVPAEVDVIVTHQSLAAQAKSKFPDAAIVPFMMFFGDPAVKGLVEALTNGDDVESAI